MGLFEQTLVDRLVALTPKQKRDELQKRIVILIGGDPRTIVNRLPPRRGCADGGLDGRVRVVRLDARGVPGLELEAGINVRVEKTPFSRADLGAFLLDMDRELLEVGIIVTAAGLTPDAELEMKRVNCRPNTTLVHLPLHDLISHEIAISSLRFVNGDLIATVRSNLEQFIRDNNSVDEAPATR